MKNFRVNLRPESYRNINDFGEIYIELDNFAFPDKNWTDFGRVIVPWWLDAIRKLLLNEKEVLCSFMDGPYRFSIKNFNENGWHIQFLEEREETRVCAEGKVSADEVTNEVLSAFKKIIDLYKTENNTEKVQALEHFNREFIEIQQKRKTKK